VCVRERRRESKQASERKRGKESERRRAGEAEKERACARKRVVMSDMFALKLIR